MCVTDECSVSGRLADERHVYCRIAYIHSIVVVLFVSFTANHSSASEWIIVDDSPPYLFNYGFVVTLDNNQNTANTCASCALCTADVREELTSDNRERRPESRIGIESHEHDCRLEAYANCSPSWMGRIDYVIVFFFFFAFHLYLCLTATHQTRKHRVTAFSRHVIAHLPSNSWQIIRRSRFTAIGCVF